MSRFAQWLAVIISTAFTLLIYIANTPGGTEAKLQLVAWIVHLGALVAVLTFFIDDDLLIHLEPKTHVIKAGADINILAQVFLLVVTGHWYLAFVRGVSELVARKALHEAQTLTS